MEVLQHISDVKIRKMADFANSSELFLLLPKTYKRAENLCINP